MRRQRRPSGFTLVELMTVVVILGILTAVAIPAFTRYVRRSRTGEATMNIRKIFDLATVYYSQELSSRMGNVLPHQFPATVTSTPQFGSVCVGGSSQKYTPTQDTWTDPSWQALSFRIDDPMLFMYTFESAGTGSASQFTARANGDMDCDTVMSTFERVAAIRGNAVAGGGGIYEHKELE